MFVITVKSSKFKSDFAHDVVVSLPTVQGIRRDVYVCVDVILKTQRCEPGFKPVV